MASSANSKITEEKIIGWYMESTMEHGIMPKSVFKFCKENKMTEEEFYGFFGSFDGLKKKIWEKFFDSTLSTIQKSKGYDEMSNEEKMLSFFFTFFENLTLNRSYVLFVLQEGADNMEKLAPLKGLRKNIKSFAEILIEERNSEQNIKILKYNTRFFSEGAWAQFLFLLKFWMSDDSPGLEKTDIAIEKSVTTIFQVFENTSLEKIIDFGKFLYKENFA